MEILEYAIKVEGGVSKLSEKLGFPYPSTVSNWRQRKSVPKGWQRVLTMKYGKRMAAAKGK